VLHICAVNPFVPADARYRHRVARRTPAPSTPGRSPRTGTRSSEAEASTSDDVVLSDPSAVRALAHPARLVVIDALYAGKVLTATECAELAGITASAMSYHLRALEKYGLVRRAESRGDARERPWMRAGANLTIRLGDKGSRSSSMSAAELLIANSVEIDRRRLVAAMHADAESGADQTWDGTTHYSRGQLLLDPDEARELVDAITAVVTPYLAENRLAADHPGALPFSATVALARDIEA
jgi:DNA-binding transcriptional ArsR family regulator